MKKMMLGMMTILAAVASNGAQASTPMPAILCASVDAPTLVLSAYGAGTPVRAKVHTMDFTNPARENNARVTHSKPYADTDAFKVSLLDQRGRATGTHLILEFRGLDRDPVHADLVAPNGMITTLNCNLDRTLRAAPAATVSN